MTITARYAATCTACHRPVTPGQQIEWRKGSRDVRHTDCDAPVAPAGPGTTDQREERPADAQPIGAQATYQGRPVYAVARTRWERGGLHGRQTVASLVTTRDGAKTLVILAGGTRTAWVPTADLRIERTYQTAWTFAGLRRRREREEAGEGCPTCGRLSCEGSRGGLCEED